ncbi:PREDICTED: uncharacterized protein LOC106123576 [Papilio xuthus]|uniref:N-acyl-aliphatic-L-amino acid amidohydrolase n=1 Tax=Papilio xuthus TaxID=66420 RepID=A0AAJ6ZM86_PAPXU|nr:PREDICTED: uncharacterized protein LOC106123576 [Papilio xuthus]
MVQPQFALSWDSYKTNICGGFSALQQNGEFVDMTLAADGHLVKVHQVLLALASPYIKELLASAPCQHPVFFLNNISYTTLSHLLEYIYTGEALVPSVNLNAFIEAAKALHIKGLETIVGHEVAVTGTPSKRNDESDSNVVFPGVRRLISTNNEIPLGRESLPLNARKILIRQSQPETTVTSSAGSTKQNTQSSYAKEDSQGFSDCDDFGNDHHDDDDDDFAILTKKRKLEDNVKVQGSTTATNLPQASNTNLQFTVSIRGSLQVILNRYMYNLNSTQNSGVKRWRCVDYRSSKCMAFLVTKGNVVINRANPHCHPYHDKKILAKIEKNAVFSALDDVEGYKEMESKREEEEMGNVSDDYSILHTRKDTQKDPVKNNEYDFNLTMTLKHLVIPERLIGFPQNLIQNYNFYCELINLHICDIDIKTFSVMLGLIVYSRMTILIYLFILFNLTFSNPIPKEYVMQKLMNESTVILLQEYMRIDTSREENIESAVLFWKRQSSVLGLPFAVYRPAKKPICVITWIGLNPKLPSIILNSHIDVVTVAEQEWKYDPFSGYIDENGDLYGRGAQDTKALSITYLEAIRTLKEKGVKLQRTIHVLLMPDEETGGFSGMVPFVETEEFRALNPGFFFDEGLTSADGNLYATYQDKRPWQLNITLHGESGHGSSVPDGSAMEKLQRLLDITREFRTQQKRIMSSKEPMDYGSYTTLNVNIINGGVATNIIPSKVNLVIDMRLSMSAQVGDFNALIQSWIEQVGNDTEVSFIRKVEVSERTTLDGSNPYWVALVEAMRDMDLKIEPIVCPATSDMVEVRNKGFPAIGFAYRPYTLPRIHAADEYINIATFQQGIQVYANILKRVANLK